jgi:DNA polymerase III subunit chi
MTDSNIYQLTKLTWSKYFPKLVESILNKGNKIFIYCESDKLLKELDEFLWTYEQLSFLPHATHIDEVPNKQPILLSTSEDNLNNANVLLVAGKCLPKNLLKFEKVILMYELNDALYTDFIKNVVMTEFVKNNINYSVFTQNLAGIWEKGTL